MSGYCSLRRVLAYSVIQKMQATVECFIFCYTSQMKHKYIIMMDRMASRLSL